ncbi:MULTISPECIES: protein kinase [unclassified Ruegeria]|uniref:protein kinase domain-containing protein n=1 Tax=unclassified Ruegeria TaxID=2625375 RepID=UPI001487B72E|nr:MULTISPECIES: protein kinase [unclassified Ruegeria]NOD36025.1 protein kinase [Ruegeria sp. HKCCD7296]NOE43418.1 protein kinase [Ruegeria sp. HKCCD7319]
MELIVTPAKKDQSTVGDLLNHTYRLEAALTRGKLKETYLARNEITGRKFAVELITGELSGNGGSLELMNLKEKLRDVTHDAIVRYVECSRLDDGRVVIISEFIEGPVLDSIVRQGGMSPENALIICRRLSAGLRVAHLQGVVHGAIAPKKVVLKNGDWEQPVLVGFTTNKLRTLDLVGRANKPRNLPSNGMQYLAPEQLAGRTEPRSDLYSLGVTLLAAVHGQDPSDTTNTSRILVNEGGARNRIVIPEPLKSGLEKMTDPEPERRFQSCDELLSHIKEKTPNSSAASSPSKRGSRSRRWKFRKGRALFNPPKLMWVDLIETVQLRIKVSDVLSVAERADMEKSMHGTGRVLEQSVSKIGLRMKAQLICEDDLLQLKSLSSDEQDILVSGVTHWDWAVRPAGTGQSVLTLRMTLRKDMDGKPITTDLEALRSVVNIEVRSPFSRPIKFWRQHWKWLVAFFVGIPSALTAWLGLLQ